MDKQEKIDREPVHCMAVINENDLVPKSWLEIGCNASNSVARISVFRYEHGLPVQTPLPYYGTGWLIGRQHIITNHHVINAREDGEKNASIEDLALQAKHAIVQFDYNPPLSEGKKLTVDSLQTFCECGSDPDLDFAILKLAQPFRSPLTLNPTYLKLHSSQKQIAVNIIQHPEGGKQMISLRNNSACRLEESDLLYYSDTLFGSSGSPVFNDDWQAIALHKCFMDTPEPLMYQGIPAYQVNMGTRIDKIIEYIKTKSPQVWSEINANIT
ncbi:MAG: serine protease [Candidatus Bathyarchaeota archaeon]|nr:serine protease [Candidatus Bathyarchaeota archaeon]